MKVKISAFLSLILIFVNINAFAKTENMINDTSSFLKNTVTNPTVNSVGGDWTVLGLARSGALNNQEYFNNYYKNVEEFVKECDGVLHTRKYTEYSRVILTLTAIGKNPENVAGYNLIAPLADFDNTTRQGINGAVWALIALDCADYQIPENSQAKTKATRGMYIDYILNRQLPDGGWALAFDEAASADPDITGMVLQALANYQDNSLVKQATEKALMKMSLIQDESGGFLSSGEKSCESTVQMIVALSTLGISVTDERFVKNGKTLLDSLESFYITGGGFSHTADKNFDPLTTEQGLYALCAIYRFESEKTALYDMSDILDKEKKMLDKPIKIESKKPLLLSQELILPCFRHLYSEVN